MRSFTAAVLLVPLVSDACSPPQCERGCTWQQEWFSDPIDAKPVQCVEGQKIDVEVVQTSCHRIDGESFTQEPSTCSVMQKNPFTHTVTCAGSGQCSVVLPASTPLFSCDCPPLSSCETNDDCAEDEHCRQATGGTGVSPCLESKVCVKRAAEGESCGGFSLECHQDLCQDGLECHVDASGPTDVPGTCKKPEICTPYTPETPCIAQEGVCYNAETCECELHLDRSLLDAECDACQQNSCRPGYSCRSSDCGGCHHQCVEDPVVCCLAFPTCPEGSEMVEGWDLESQFECDTNPDSCEQVSMCCSTITCKKQKQKSCTLPGGGSVESGSSFPGAGRNSCNTCGCSDGVLSCTEMACEQCPCGNCAVGCSPIAVTCSAVEGKFGNGERYSSAGGLRPEPCDFRGCGAYWISSCSDCTANAVSIGGDVRGPSACVEQPAGFEDLQVCTCAPVNTMFEEGSTCCYSQWAGGCDTYAEPEGPGTKGRCSHNGDLPCSNNGHCEQEEPPHCCWSATTSPFCGGYIACGMMDSEVPCVNGGRCSNNPGNSCSADTDCQFV